MPMAPIYCTVCESAPAAFRSDQWVGVEVCRDCVMITLRFLVEHNLAKDNPFFYSLADGIAEPYSIGGQFFWRTWHRNGHNSFEQRLTLA